MAMIESVVTPENFRSRLGAIDAINRQCFCISLDKQALARALDSELGQAGLSELVRQGCPFMFAAEPVFLAASHLRRMAQVVQAVESVVALPVYRDQVLATAPAIAQLNANGSRGVFFGYDFHLDQGRLGLIEINTNAGGAMLNAVLARAQRVACAATDAMVPTLASIAAFEQNIVDMFRHEWNLAGHTRTLASIAIVDEAPEQQYLYPEFLLFQQLFERHGLRAVIADPTALELRDGKLWHDDLVIDLVYNRLTDFYLEQTQSAVLREAYVQKNVVLTPDPQAHALYADKRRLALFSDAARLSALGVPEVTQQILLEHVPQTEVVNATDAQRLWTARRGLFFKPVAGYGSRAAYRGDKLTRRVWQEILAGDYVAQAIVAPGERMIDEQDVIKTMKFDLRAYAYDCAVQWVAARLYQGQTTNFRTPGGGFAPVYSSTDVSGRTLLCCSDDGIVNHAADSASSAAEAGHASYVFLLDADSGIHAVPHGLYVALARGLAAAPALAGQTLRLADWFVQLKDGAPDSVVNESYSQLRFGADGYVDRAATPIVRLEHADTATVPGDVDWPTAEEHERMHALLFDDDVSSAMPSSSISSPHPDTPPNNSGRHCR